MSSNTFVSMVQGYTDAQVPVDQITEGSPLFGSSFWGKTNNGFSHKYEELQSIIAAQAVDLNAVYPTIGAEFEMGDRDIAMFAGTREVHVNTVDQMANGSLDAYLEKEMPSVFAQTLMNVSFDFYYGVNIPFANANQKVIDASGGTATGNKYSSIHVIRWQDGQYQGLYNDKWAQAKGGVFTATKLSGGDRYKNSDDKSVYGVDVEMPLGFLPVNAQNVSVIANIDLATIEDADLGRFVTDAVVQARPGKGGMIKAYANPVTIARLGNLKEAQNLGIQNNGLYSVVIAGVEFIGDWNLLEGVEAPVTLL